MDYALCTWCTSYNALCTWCTLYKTLMHLCANWHLCERRWASSRNVIMNTTARIRIIMNTARIWVHVNTSWTNSYQTSGYILYACEHINQVCTVRINQILIKPQFYGQDVYVGNWSTSLVLPFLYIVLYTHTHKNVLEHQINTFWFCPVLSFSCVEPRSECNCDLSNVLSCDRPSLPLSVVSTQPRTFLNKIVIKIEKRQSFYAIWVGLV